MNQAEQAVSPTISVVLVVAISIGLAVGVFVAVDGMGAEDTEPTQTATKLDPGRMTTQQPFSVGTLIAPSHIASTATLFTP